MTKDEAIREITHRIKQRTWPMMHVEDYHRACVSAMVEVLAEVIDGYERRKEATDRQPPGGYFGPG